MIVFLFVEQAYDFIIRCYDCLVTDKKSGIDAGFIPLIYKGIWIYGIERIMFCYAISTLRNFWILPNLDYNFLQNYRNDS